MPLIFPSISVSLMWVLLVPAQLPGTSIPQCDSTQLWDKPG